jgi:hypothetical protein
MGCLVLHLLDLLEFPKREKLGTKMKVLKTILMVAVVAASFAPEMAMAKKKSGSSDNFTPTAEQKKRAYEQGLKNCRKKYGSQLHEVHVEKFYGRWGAVCYHY